MEYKCNKIFLFTTILLNIIFTSFVVLYGNIYDQTNTCCNKFLTENILYPNNNIWNKTLTKTNTKKNIIIQTENIELPKSVYQYNLSPKPYMDYKKITDKSSSQWKYIHESGKITVDDYGFLLTEDGYIGVAMGSFFGDIGSKYKIYLDTGKIKQVVKVERKKDKDTCKYNIVGNPKICPNLIELVIDTSTEYMKNNIGSNGLIFNGSFNNSEEFKGNIIKIEKIIE